MLNKIGKNEHPYLVPDVKRKISKFLPLSVKLDLGFFVDVLYEV